MLYSGRVVRDAMAVQDRAYGKCMMNLSFTVNAS